MKNLKMTNECNMELMPRYPDNYFDLAIVDPQYGIGEDGAKNHSRGQATKATMYTPKYWDSNAPEKEYFKELRRVSKNQIIWGANHFIDNIGLANTPSWIVWDKENGNNDFADCELAWSSFKTSVRRFKFRWAGMLQGDMKNKEIRIHPTQKPVALYKWLLLKYANKGDKILDTHLGSGSIAIAVNDVNNIEKMDLELTACELDKEYFEKSMIRIKEAISQKTLF